MGYLCVPHVTGRFAVRLTVTCADGQVVEAKPASEKDAVVQVPDEAVCTIEVTADRQGHASFTTSVSEGQGEKGACFFGKLSPEDDTRSHLTSWSVRVEGEQSNWFGTLNQETKGFLCARNVSGQFTVSVRASGPDLGQDVEVPPMPGASRRISVDKDKIGVIGIQTRDGGKSVCFWTESNKDWI